MSYGSTNILTTATQIVAAESARQALIIVNADDSKTIYIGPDSSVTALTGIPLYANQTKDFTKNTPGYWSGPVYGIVAAADTSAYIRYWEVNTR